MKRYSASEIRALASGVDGLDLSAVDEEKGSNWGTENCAQPPPLSLALLNRGRGNESAAASSFVNGDGFQFSPRVLPTPRMRLQKALALDRKIDEEMLQQGWVQITRTAKKIDGVYTLVTAFYRGEDLRISVYVVNSSRVHEITIKSRRLPSFKPQRVKEYVVYIVGKYCFDDDGNLVRKKKGGRKGRDKGSSAQRGDENVRSGKVERAKDKSFKK